VEEAMPHSTSSSASSNEGGLALPGAEDWSRYVGELNIVDSVSAPDVRVSDTRICDSASFPAIGNQGSQGSCAAWAATYYCYGYQEAVDQGWTQAKSGLASQLLSPAWTFNRVLVDGGGSWMWDNFLIVRDWGVPTMATMPYDAGNSINWGSEAAWREAPLHRGLELFSLNYAGAGTINDIKSLIGQGIPVTFCVDANNFYTAFEDGNWVISSVEYTQSVLNHAQTIVGYNDGISDDGNLGAFRVANSWGAAWGDSGYYWLTYEAVKEIGASAVDPEDEIHDNLCLSYITDRPDYVPETTAVWQFDMFANHCGGSDATITLSSVRDSEVLATFQPYTYISRRSATHYFPSFMLADISDLGPAVIEGASVQLSLGAPQQGGNCSLLTSFKIEEFSGYSPGTVVEASRISRQAAGLPMWQPLTAAVALDAVGDIGWSAALDSPGKEYACGGTSSWVGVASEWKEGGGSLQSGVIGDSSVSALQTWVYGPGSLSFWWKVSSEPDCDFLRFYIDGTSPANLKQSISGSTGWQQVSCDFGAGKHLVTWHYAKDYSQTVGEDAGWIDGVSFVQADDAYEDNDVREDAKDIGVGHISGLVCADADWYRIHLEAGDDLTVSASFSNAYGNLDMVLVALDGTERRAASQDDGETLALTMVPEAGDALLAIFGFQGAVNTYTLDIDIDTNFAPGSESSVAIEGGTGSYGVLDMDASLSVWPGDEIAGSLHGTLFSAWPGEGMPLVALASWWDSAEFMAMDMYVFEGVTPFTMDLGRFQAPSMPGDYYILVAFHPEPGGAAYLASCTHFALEAPVWGDGNDLGRLTEAQLEAAEADGRVMVSYLVSDGEYFSIHVPCAVVRVHVMDDMAPETKATAFGSEGDSGWYTSSVSVLLEASDVGSGVAGTYFRLDGGALARYTAPVGIIGDGTHTVCYWSMDWMGNAEAERTLSVRIDTSLPSAAIEVQPSASPGLEGYDLGRPLITLTSADVVSGPREIAYRYDDGPWRQYSAPFYYELAGPSTLSVIAIDVAGNEGAAVPRQMKVDTLAPSVLPMLEGSRGNGQWYDSDVTVTFIVTEAGSGLAAMSYSFDGSDYLPYSSPFRISESGEHHIWIRAGDVAGNVGTYICQVSMDLEAPLMSMTIEGDQGNGIWWKGPVVITLGAEDPCSGVDRILYSIDGGNWAIFAEPFQVSGEGRHAISLKAADNAGNLAEQTDFEIGIDTTPPAAALSLVGVEGDPEWLQQHPRPLVQVIDALSGPGKVEMTLDGEPVSYEEGAPIEAEGEHVLGYRAADAAGNFGEWRTVALRVDTIAPLVQLALSGAAGQGGWYVDDVVVTCAVIENGSGMCSIQVRWDGGTWSSINVTLVCAAQGRRSLEVRAADNAGNSFTAGPVQVWLDRSPPAVVLSSGAEQAITSSAGLVSWSGGDALSGMASISVSLDGGPFVEHAGSESHVHIDGLSDGRHGVVVRFVDEAGNSAELRTALTVDTNPLSPSGPYGAWPVLFIVAAAAMVAAAVWWRRR
jgi:C1A family cysteine protease